MDRGTTTTSEPRAHSVIGNLREIVSQELVAMHRPLTTVSGACPASGAKSTTNLSSIFTNNTCRTGIRSSHEAMMMLNT